MGCELNWRDNPWFPRVLDEERRKAKRTMLPDDYAHIWEGKARSVCRLGPSTGTKWKRFFWTTGRAMCPMTRRSWCTQSGISDGTTP